MELSRRDFLKVSGAGVGSLFAVAGLPGATQAAGEDKTFRLHKRISETWSICPYCAVGCGIILASQDGRVTNCEGDPDHPINKGSLDPKSVATAQLVNNPKRLTKPLYRAPGADKWEEKSWDWMLTEIAKRVKATRDATWTDKAGEVTVNRTEAIAWLGGAANNNEDCYLGAKLMRSLGVVYLEHQARI